MERLDVYAIFRKLKSAYPAHSLVISNMCEEEEFSLAVKEVLVNNTDLGCQVMVMNSGAPVSLCGLQ